jgi:hypothetical protein
MPIGRTPPLFLVAVVAAAGCAASPAMRAAENGDFAALRAEVARRAQKGDLDNGDAADLAKAVASREIETATKAADAEARVGDAASCARELDSALERRMQTKDDGGAAAALARYETGELDEGDARDHARDADPAWRAVGARGLVRVQDRAPRAIALRDPDARVRRQAVRAARDAQDPQDLAQLVDVARVDPEPIVRTEAVRAMAALPPDAALANRLRDLWTAGDDDLREDIAMAWAAPGLFEQGGREALRVVLASGKDAAGVVEAAAAVELVAPHDRDLWDEASSAILRAIDDGAPRARLHAIAVVRLPADDATLAALKKASTEADVEVRVAALARLLEVPAERTSATTSLEALAGGEDAAVAAHARFALANAGDGKIEPSLTRELAAQDPYEKLGAATALAALGRSAKAASLLADPDPMVRTRAACTLLMAVRRKR